MTLRFALLDGMHERKNFCCGEPALDAYMRQQAAQDMKRGFATVIVAAEQTAPSTIVGYYTLSAASILLSDLPESMLRRMPRYPDVPAVRLGRLAVSQDRQKQHIGSLLLLDSLYRACNTELGWAFFIVDAKNEHVASFYEKFQFSTFADTKKHLWMTRRQAEHLVRGM
jgi:ribosomal protein S18 acetylase RimI-like enzyme